MAFEAETCQTLNTQHTRQQWTAFDNRARRINGVFHAVVPNPCFEEAQRLMSEWGLHGIVFTPTRQ